jgi:hypothetical protein
MLDKTHLRSVPRPLFNELEEVRVRSHMGLSMFCLVIPKTENSKVFHDYRVWKNT